MKKIFIILIFIIALISYFFIGNPPESKKIVWGVNFSQKHSKDLGLDWKENYKGLLNDLNVKNIKLITHWDLIEPKQNNYFFDDLDWQINEASSKGAKLLLVVGMKTGRWPECHVPEWAKKLNKEQQQERISKLIKKIVLRYKAQSNISMWQVENEAFFPFGDCPWYDKEFLKKEIDLVKSLDQRKILISDSGELSFWQKPAKFGDMVGITMYQRVWFKELKRYIRYPFTPMFYWRKTQIIKKLFNKKVIVVELQAEPWGETLLYNSPIVEQRKTMDLEKFQESIKFAKKTGIDEFYLWGSEWWYWLKEKQDEPSIWNEAKNLFISN